MLDEVFEKAKEEDLSIDAHKGLAFEG